MMVLHLGGLLMAAVLMVSLSSDALDMMEEASWRRCLQG
jgi:hypothetical protein